MTSKPLHNVATEQGTTSLLHFTPLCETEQSNNLFDQYQNLMDWNSMKGK
jgi:hypothetical protein